MHLFNPGDRCVQSSQSWRNSYTCLQGTWQFLSAMLCHVPRKKHQLQDDLESFIHVVMYTALRYMRNTYSQQVLANQMEALYDNAKPHKPSMFFFGLADFMSSPFVLPDAPPLVKWIEEVCVFANQWLVCPYSRATIDPITQKTMLVMPGPVPTDISLHNHDAMLQLWKSALESEDWVMTTPHPACDNLAKAEEKTVSLPLPSSASAIAVQSEKKSNDTPPSPSTSRKRSSQRNPERMSKKPRKD